MHPKVTGGRRIEARAAAGDVLRTRDDHQWL